MPGLPAYYTFDSTTITLVTTAETVVSTTKAVSSPYAGCIFAVQFTGIYISGTGVTAFSMRVRRGSLTGTVVANTGNINAAASSTQIITFGATDSQAGELTGAVYVFTVTQVAATGNGSVANTLNVITTSS